MDGREEGKVELNVPQTTNEDRTPPPPLSAVVLDQVCEAKKGDEMNQLSGKGLRVNGEGKGGKSLSPPLVRCLPLLIFGSFCLVEIRLGYESGRDSSCSL